MATLGDRHKAYEAAAESRLDLQHAVVLRIDGRAFHTFTRGFSRPFDERLHRAFVSTVQHLMAKLHGASHGYTQSDEITLLFPVKTTRDGERRVDLPFAGRVQKLVSVAASMATGAFHAALQKELKDDPQLLDRKGSAVEFDARVFNLTPDEAHRDTNEEACGNVELQNNLLWRQRDCVKNSIQSFALQHLSQKQVFGLHGEQMIAAVEAATGVIWNELEPWKKYGTLVVRLPEGEFVTSHPKP